MGKSYRVEWLEKRTAAPSHVEDFADFFDGETYFTAVTQDGKADNAVFIELKDGVEVRRQTYTDPDLLDAQAAIADQIITEILAEEKAKAMRVALETRLNSLKHLAANRSWMGYGQYEMNHAQGYEAAQDAEIEFLEGVLNG